MYGYLCLNHVTMTCRYSAGRSLKVPSLAQEENCGKKIFFSKLCIFAHTCFAITASTFSSNISIYIFNESKISLQLFGIPILGKQRYFFNLCAHYVLCQTTKQNGAAGEDQNATTQTADLDHTAATIQVLYASIVLVAVHVILG